ncbi:FAD-dependent oxidoreductase [Niastella vici]|uniref:FAD-dependent oxidoreductase n=1 Tax=Niastella vici TaxID=1703345 RepID=A0A1V9FG29_9BACT|nr:NAD(P)/FAD-dependent oxidoreductase [Niastella vici]OQP57221.1 FAD-dependent oxidoreductase [Niastella vici]
MSKYDAIVVGAGPNGLSAAITLQQAGVSVLLLEGKETIGGGLRTAEITLPGFLHDVCSAIHPMAVASPFFNSLPLQEYGLEFIVPDIAAAHPFDDGTAAVLKRSFRETAQLLGADEGSYTRLIAPLLQHWPLIAPDLLGPLHFPKHPLEMAQFGVHALTSASYLSGRFHTEKAKALWAGMAGHAIQSLSNAATSAIGLVLIAVAHVKGWPIPKGGSVSIANALANHFISLGGTIETNAWVHSLKQLPTAKVVLFDVTPRQLLQIAGDRFSSFYTRQLQRYQYGMGVFKLDWALREPIPFMAPECRQAGTVHIGNTMAEIAASEQLSAKGIHPEKPFVLLAQPSVFDVTRAPQGKHTAWAYCHVPHGSMVDMTAAIENQVERFAPGFKELILARHTMNTAQLEAYNPNYIGGDINGGIINLRQLYTRPAIRWSPYTTPAKGIYICSSSTPPGGGVHGMCGYHAACKALKDEFSIIVNAYEY